MRQAINDLLTGDDNLTLDIFRVLACASILVALVLQCITVAFPDRRFDIQAYGIGLGSILLAVGGALRLKDGPTSAPPEPK